MLIKLKVHPKSKAISISKRSEDSYEIWVKAPAEQGLANRAALQALAQTLAIEAKRLHIVKGAASPNKIVKVFGL